jgi:hypothetical protein
MAEYSAIAVGFDFKKDVSTMPLKEFNNQLTEVVGGLINEIVDLAQPIQGGHWSVLSHSSTFVGNRLLVTVLFHR